MNPDNDVANYVLHDVKSENGNACSSSEFEEQEIFSAELNIKEETNSFIPLCIKSEIDSKDDTIIVGDVKVHNFSQDSYANSVHLPCTRCGFMFLNPFYQKQHQRKCKNVDSSPADRKYTCGACNEEFTKISNIQQHMLKHTDKRWPICSYCNKVFSEFNTLREHMRIHTNEKHCCCSICDKKFSSLNNLNTHMEIHTGEKPYCCDICDKTFSQFNSLEMHIRTHNGEKPYHCTICDKAFSFMTSIRVHMRIHTGENICSICGKIFSHSGHLYRHMKIHDGSHGNSVHLPCTQCGFMFLNPFYQKQHQEKCKNVDSSLCDRKYTCGACNEEFTEIPDIRQHILKHIDKQWQIYSDSNKVFSESNSVLKYKRTHMGVVFYFCSICDKRFSQLYNLKLHMRIHTGEKPYCCSICNKTFAKGNNLKQHSMRIHSRYCCAICNETFSKFCNLKKHMSNHTGEEPYCCAVCD